MGTSTGVRLAAADDLEAMAHTQALTFETGGEVTLRDGPTVWPMRRDPEPSSAP